MLRKKSDPTDIWAWLYKDADRLSKKGGQWQTILDGYEEFNQLMYDDHIAAELAISQALNAARETAELKWQLHLRHWRLQLWLQQRQAKRVLPEAIDLLSLATDRRVKDVPQRLCAYHDVVDCYVEMDPAGYYHEIVENANDILNQLPQKHPCATCARIHIAQATAATGRTEEAEHWLNLTRATLTQPIHPGLANSIASTKVTLKKWDDAEQVYQEALKLARERKQSTSYLTALLGLARISLEKNDIPRAFETLQEARRASKHMGGNAHLALLLEIEGRFFAATKQETTALEYLAQAAQLYLDLGCYRDAAQTALYAAEFAHTAKQTLSEEVLLVAAKAVGQMPKTSQDVYQRLADLGKEPITEIENEQATSPEEQAKKELETLQSMLQVHIEHKHIHDLMTTLYRIGRWYCAHEEYRAAVDYLIANAALERLLKLPMEDREDALGTLGNLQKLLPAGTIEAAMTATESGPPDLLKPVVAEVPLARWSWVIRSLATELAGQPVVEPEPNPAKEDGAQNFQLWIEHVASMTALLVRFKDKLEPTDRQHWINTLQEVETEIARDKQEFLAANGGEDSSEEVEAENATLISLLRGLIALAQGATIEDIKPTVLEPFTSLIEQIGEIAEMPVWFHPEWSPLDFLIEHAAQEAVYALRKQDDHHSNRLTNLAFRYKLMTIDMQPEEPLQPIVQLLNALRELLLSDGQDLPTLAPLPDGDETFKTILTAVYEASKQNT